MQLYVVIGKIISIFDIIILSLSLSSVRVRVQIFIFCAPIAAHELKKK